ncbi:MAG: LLM class F420-dependent oxidoreductase [Acidimicrobiales bacterium]
MKIGYLTINCATQIRPDTLARELEERGFDSIWVPEHSHIPADRRSPYPGGGELPSGYWSMMDPFVSLQAAAAATKDLILATGICLLLERDVLALAKTVATVDVLSGGRMLLGVGVGWNEEELANHRTDLAFGRRYSAMRERVAALRSLWHDEEPTFDGEWDRFTPVMSDPRPLQNPLPVALGNAGPIGIGHAAEYADQWCPIDASLMNTDGKPHVAGGIALFRQKAEAAGRNPDDIPISLFAWGRPPQDRLESYAELGVERVVLGPGSFDAGDDDQTMPFLERFTPMVAALA